MVALQIRHVPADVRDTLAGRAAARGQSLQSFLLDLVTTEAQRSANVRLLVDFGHRHDGTHLTRAEAQETVVQARSERDAGR